MTLYSAGSCSVCADAGAAVFVRCLRSGKLFFACGGCGVAWLEPPVPHLVDTVTAPLEIAPDGWIAATLSEITSAGLAPLVHHELSEDTDAFFAGVFGYRSIG